MPLVAIEAAMSLGATEAALSLVGIEEALSPGGIGKGSRRAATGAGSRGGMSAWPPTSGLAMSPVWAEARLRRGGSLHDRLFRPLFDDTRGGRARRVLSLRRVQCGLVGRHPGAWRPYGWGVGRFWGWSTWPGLVTWFGWTAPPVYYDFGNTIVYTGDQVYIDGQPGPTATEYYQQAADLALSAPPAPPPVNKDEEWNPLGVFALVQGEQSDTGAVFQLAVNKAGIIRGNYYNVLTDTNLAVRGAVDQKTQRASWVVGDQKTTIYDTGIVNLTRDESPLLIHFGKERTQQWLLVRVKEKDEKVPADAGGGELPVPPEDGAEAARVTVIVPANAELFFDGVATTKTGTERSFKTPPLKRGGNFAYSIRARWTQPNGFPVEQTRKVLVKAGRRFGLILLARCREG